MPYFPLFATSGQMLASLTKETLPDTMNKEKKYVGRTLLFFMNLFFTTLFASLFLVPIVLLLNGLGMSPPRALMGLVIILCFFAGALCLQKVKRSIEIDKQGIASIQSYSPIALIIIVVAVGVFLFVLFTKMPELTLPAKLLITVVYSVGIAFLVKVHRFIKFYHDQMIIASLWGKQVIRFADIQNVECARERPLGKPYLISYWYQLTLSNGKKVRITMMNTDEVNIVPLKYFKTNRIPVINVQHGVFERMAKMFF